MDSKSYKNRLRYLGLWTLEERKKYTGFDWIIQDFEGSVSQWLF